MSTGAFWGFFYFLPLRAEWANNLRDGLKLGNIHWRCYKKRQIGERRDLDGADKWMWRFWVDRAEFECFNFVDKINLD